MFETETALPLANAAASAPGDLPLIEVERRIAAHRVQFRHDNTIEPFAPLPHLPVGVVARSGEDLPVLKAAVFYTTDGSLPHRESTRVPMQPDGVEWQIHSGYLTRWQADIPGQPEGSVVRYRIGGWLQSEDTSAEDPPLWAQDGQGFWFREEAEKGITTFAYSVESAGHPLPDWVRDAVIYEIFLDRFHPGTADGAFPHGLDAHALHGGTLRGVQDALPYLADLGITCLWLTPITVSPSYHRYDPSNYLMVDPRAGSNDDLRALVKEVHARGLRIVLDFVPAHLSSEHPAFQASQVDCRAASASWFTFYQHPHHYRSFLASVPSLPSLNTDDPAAREHVIGSAVQWLSNYGVDGLRIDHAIGCSMDFFVALRQTMREVAPQAFTVGEVTDTPDSLRRFRNRLDAIMDFPLASALRQTFGRGEWDFRRLDSMLRSYESYMADGPGRLSFLDNHDMNRFAYEAGGDVDRVKMAALCQFTLDPTPVIYYGTEIGLAQERSTEGFGGDVEVRRDMLWNGDGWDLDLLSFYRRLIALRRASPVLRHGGRRTIHVDVDTATWAYLRLSADDAGGTGEEMAVAFNLGHSPGTVPLPAGGWRVLLSTGEPPTVRTGQTLLPAMSGAVFGR